MKSVFLSVLACLALAIPSAGAMQVARPPLNPIQNLVLTNQNTVTFRGVVTDQSVAAAQLRLLDISRSLKPSNVIYLVLDTPGGSVEAGLQLIDTIKSLPQEVKTVTVFAASMGFHIAQNSGERLIMQSGVLMSHRATLSGMEGEIGGELDTRINFYRRTIQRMDEQVARRMQMETKAYQAMIADEYWVRGEEAKTDRATDTVIVGHCDKSFQGTENVLLGQFMGIPVFGTMSKCPLISGILGITLGEGGDEESREEAEEFARTYKANKRKVVSDYILTGKFQRTK